MDSRSENAPSGDLGQVEQLLLRERAKASPLELDRIKLAAISRRGGRRARAGRRTSAPVRGLVPLVTALVLMASGIGIFAAAKDSKHYLNTGSAASSQYCPPPAQGPPKPKGGDNRCGQPKTK